MFEIVGISTVLLIAGIVELIKKMGVSGDILVLISVVIGVVFGVVFKAYDMYPAAQPWIELAYFSLAFGLGASGLYDIANGLASKE